MSKVLIYNLLDLKIDDTYTDIINIRDDLPPTKDIEVCNICIIFTNTELLKLDNMKSSICYLNRRKIPIVLFIKACKRKIYLSDDYLENLSKCYVMFNEYCTITPREISMDLIKSLISNVSEERIVVNNISHVTKILEKCLE